MIIRDPPAGAVTTDGSIIPDVVVFPEEFPSPNSPNPDLPNLEDIHFAEVLFDVLTGIKNLSNETVKKHIWWHDLTYNDGRIEKDIWNAWNEDLTLTTHSIEYSRISDVT
jgi:hypothetical protein